MKDWIRLARFGNQTDFLLVQSILQTYKIDFIILNSHTYYLDPLTVELSDLATILVRIETYKESMKILTENNYGKYLIEE